MIVGLGLRHPAPLGRTGWYRARSASFVEFMRGTPLLVQLYFLFYILPDLGILLAPLVAGVIGLGLHYGTYTAEVYRAGIDNVPRGQWEAAKAVNLTMRQTWMHIIIPQAMPPMIPALANYFIAMFKETPLLSAITVLELMNQASSVANSNYRYVEPMTLVGVFFLDHQPALGDPSALARARASANRTGTNDDGASPLRRARPRLDRRAPGRQAHRPGRSWPPTTRPSAISPASCRARRDRRLRQPHRLRQSRRRRKTCARWSRR